MKKSQGLIHTKQNHKMENHVIILLSLLVIRGKKKRFFLIKIHSFIRL